MHARCRGGGQKAGLCLCRRQRARGGKVVAAAAATQRGAERMWTLMQACVYFLLFCSHPQLPAARHSPLSPSMPGKNASLLTSLPPTSSPIPLFEVPSLSLFGSLSSFPSSVLPVLSSGRASCLPSCSCSRGSHRHLHCPYPLPQ